MPVSFPEIRNGYLVFETPEIFSTYISNLKTMEIEELVNWNKEHNYLSFYDLKQLTPEEATEKGIDNSKLNGITPADEHLNLCLSPYKKIQIGNIIYQIDSPFIIACVDGHEGEIQEMKNAYNSREFQVADDSTKSFSENLSVSKIGIEGMGKTETAMTGGGFGRHDREKIINFDPDRRYHVDIFWENWYFYKSCGLKTETDQFSGWWIFRWWRLVSCPGLAASWECRIDYPYGGQTGLLLTDNSQMSRQNTGIVVHTFLWTAQAGFHTSGGQITGPPTGVTGFPNMEYMHVNSNHTINWFNSRVWRENLRWN